MLRDLKIAVRHLLKSPGFSAIAVLMLTLGIGATTAIFSIVEGVLLRPLPFPNPNELVVISDTIKGAEIAGNDEAGVTATDVVNYTHDTQSFTALGGDQLNGNELSGTGDPAQINDARMTPASSPRSAFSRSSVAFSPLRRTRTAPQLPSSATPPGSRAFTATPRSSAAKFSSTANPTSSSGSCRAALSFPFSPGI